jgi:hypothetical protein
MSVKHNEEIAKSPKKWSAGRKAEVVLRHLKGEPLDSLSREIGVSASRIEEWVHRAMGGMTSSLKDREGDPLQGALDMAKKRIGDLSMEIELLREKNRKKGVFWGGKW